MISIVERAIIAGKYRLERPLARGGMGSVWVAQHLQLDVAMAIKFMDAAVVASAGGRARFALEARVAARLRSPNVVQVHDYGVEEGTPYLVMELLEGEHLGARLKRVRQLDLSAAQAVVTQVCRALRRAHDAGVVHRDLKPSNIFLARHHEDEIVKVFDFGIAKATGEGALEEATKTGMVMGSPHYLSPEQARDSKRLDHRSDLWSLGVVAFRALTGELPFSGNELLDVLKKLSSEPIPLPSRVAPHLGLDVDRFFARALARDPALRFQSANELAEAFSALVEPRARLAVTSVPAPRATEPPTPTAPAFTAIRSHRVPSPAQRSRIMPLAPVRWASERAELKTWFPASSVVVVEFSGHLTASAVKRLIASVAPALACAGLIDAFNNWQDMTGYDSEARLALSEWVIETRRFSSVNILVRSKLVAMGVAVANLAVGGTIASYTSRSSWQAALNDIVNRTRAEGALSTAR